MRSYRRCDACKSASHVSESCTGQHETNLPTTEPDARGLVFRACSELTRVSLAARLMIVEIGSRDGARESASALRRNTLKGCEVRHWKNQGGRHHSFRVRFHEDHVSVPSYCSREKNFRLFVESPQLKDRGASIGTCQGKHEPLCVCGRSTLTLAVMYVKDGECGIALCMVYNQALIRSV